MQVNSLKLTNFRSYKDFSLSFGPKTIIIGENAKGKTNILEALYLLSVGKSFRGKEADLTSWEEDYCRIEAEAATNNPIRIEYIFENNVGTGRKTVKINGAKKPSSALLGGLRCIFFSPDEVDMFFGFPAERRRHFNVLISQKKREYANELLQYSKVLAQRNVLLRLIAEGRAREKEIEVWDGKLASHGAKIISERKLLIGELKKDIKAKYFEIAGNRDELTLEYRPSIEGEDDAENDVWASCVQSLLKSRGKDLRTRVTNMGPHRDNFVFMINGRPAEAFASRGELRSVILTLKITEKDYLTENRQMPILLLDDVFSELDEKRRGYLVKSFGEQQTIVTTTDLDHIDTAFRKTADIYEIKDKGISRV